MEDFEKIYSQYFDIVFRYVLSLCKDETLAEEITQEAFFKALKKIDSFRVDCKINVWLCQIAKHTYYSISENKKKYVDYSYERIPDTKSIEQTIFNKEMAMQIYKILHKLEEPYKEVFWMRTFCVGEKPLKPEKSQVFQPDFLSVLKTFEVSFSSLNFIGF